MTKTVEEVIGANVAVLRGGETQAALGSALAPFLGGEGWSRQTVWKAERGMRQFTPAELLALAAVLDVTLPQLFESPDPVKLPGGTLSAEAIDALVAGTNDVRDYHVRLSAAVRGMERVGQDLNRLSLLHAAQLARLDRAIHGAPDPEPPVESAPSFARAAYSADRLAARLEQPREEHPNG